MGEQSLPMPPSEGQALSDPILLAIETSQRRGGVAVRDAAGDAHTEALEAGRWHDDDLIAAVDRLFARLGLEPSDLGVVGVSVGPGGFTGLRIAVSTAKMFAESLGAKLVAVPSALVVAESYRGAGPILVALACKDDRFWAARLERCRGAGGGWVIVGEPGLVDAGTFGVDGLDAVLGDAYLPPAAGRRCRSAGVGIVEPSFDAAACLAVSWRLWLAGEITDPLRLAPVYARPPATTLP